MKKTILLIDDDNDFVMAQKALISSLGYDIITANSGADGFLMAKEYHPDLIILDVNMEREFSGFEVHQKIRLDKALINIPIIILTGIETYQIGEQIIDMYRSLRGKDDFEINRVLRITDQLRGEVAVEYFDEDGKAVYLPLDSFISKTNADTHLLKEIQNILNK